MKKLPVKLLFFGLLSLMVLGNAVFSDSSILNLKKDFLADFGQLALSSGSTYQLSVSVNALSGAAGSTIISSPAGINCDTLSLYSSNCIAQFPSGASVTLTPNPANSGTTLTGWGSACLGVSPSGPCTITMTGNLIVGATFSYSASAPPALSVTVASIGAAGSDTGGTVVSSPAGIDCSTSPIKDPQNCVAIYSLNQSVTLTAAAKAPAVFSSWGGACTGTTGSICTVTMDASKSATAAFKFPPGLQVKITDYSPATGSAVSSDGNINCGSDCAEYFDPNTLPQTIGLTAIPGSGSALSSWFGCISSSANPTNCSVTITATTTLKSVTATFNSGYSLTVGKTGSGSGLITSKDGSIDCGTVCSSIHAFNTYVYLTASPDPGSGIQWSGCYGLSANNLTCTVYVSGPVSISANFIKNNLQVQVSGSGGGLVAWGPNGSTCNAGQSPCNETYNVVEQIGFTATPSSTNEVVTWGGDCSYSSGSTCSLPMDSDKSVTVSFDPPRLTMTKSGSGFGTVKDNYGKLNCGPSCASASADYFLGQIVTLTATPDTSSQATYSSFGSWSGCDSFTGNICNVSMYKLKSVTAVFNPFSSYTLNIQNSGTGGGTISASGLNCTTFPCSQTFSSPTSLILTPVPAAGSKVTGWLGCDSVDNSSNPPKCIINLQ